MPASWCQAPYSACALAAEAKVAKVKLVRRSSFRSMTRNQERGWWTRTGGSPRANHEGVVRELVRCERRSVHPLESRGESIRMP